MTPRRQDRPLIILAEEAVGRAAHMGQILGMGADAAQHAEDRLDEKRRLQQAAVEEMGEGVEMADVVAFAFETGAAALAQLADEALDLREGVGDDQVLGALDIGLLPIVFPVLDLLGDMEDAEIHRAHVEGAELGLGPQRCGEAVLHAHAQRAAGGDVDDRVAGLLDAGQELHEDGGIGRRPPVLGIAGMEMDDRGARLRRIDRIPGDLVRGDGQIGRHAGGMDRAGDGAGDDDLSRPLLARGFLARNRLARRALPCHVA